MPALLQPVFALVLLTFVVVTRLLYVRIRAVTSGAVKMSYYKDLTGDAPPSLVANQKNFANLFEMPVLFYLVAVLLIVTQRADAIYVGLAWAYVACRCAHTLVHLTFNAIPARLAAYALSNLALLAMWGRFAFQTLG